MVKARRNRQPKDWQKMVKPRSHSGILVSKVDNSIQKLTDESQLRKVNKALKRLRKQIARNKAERDNSLTTKERKSWIEGALLKLERRLTKLVISHLVLSGKSEKGKERLDNKKAKEKKTDEIKLANAEKIKPGIQKYPTFDTGSHPGLSGKGKIKEFIEVLGGKKRRVKRKFLTEERALPQTKGDMSGKVKVINPNRKGTIFLPKKG